MPNSLPNGPTTWDPAELPAPAGAEALMSMARPAFAAAVEFNGKLADNAIKLGAEWADFLRRRLQQDIAVPQRLAACKSPQEAQEVCVGYWTTAFAQYQDEIGRLARLGQAFTEQATAAMCTHAGRVTHHMQVAA